MVLKKVGNEEQSKSFQKWLAQCVPQFLCFQRSSKRHQCFPSYSSLHLRIQNEERNQTFTEMVTAVYTTISLFARLKQPQKESQKNHR